MLTGTEQKKKKKKSAAQTLAVSIETGIFPSIGAISLPEALLQNPYQLHARVVLLPAPQHHAHCPCPLPAEHLLEPHHTTLPSQTTANQTPAGSQATRPAPAPPARCCRQLLLALAAARRPSPGRSWAEGAPRVHAPPCRAPAAGSP